MRPIAISAAAAALPCGVLMTSTPLRGGGLDVDVVDADAGAADDLQLAGVREDRRGDLGRRADPQAVVLADDGRQLFGFQADLDVDREPRLLQDLDGALGHVIGNQDSDRIGHFLFSSQ